ncbi:olfactory receptor 51H1-like [Otolemur garnettii]|uniref:olfactory receptor 51H1-like n=1 Tax=Otolemur garnettii TaxID=30611 RepID=UPI000C7E97E7|nr:olfactory receptor 51H1-like [Otolemur garnettii]
MTTEVAGPQLRPPALRAHGRPEPGVGGRGSGRRRRGALTPGSPRAPHHHLEQLGFLLVQEPWECQPRVHTFAGIRCVGSGTRAGCGGEEKPSVLAESGRSAPLLRCGSRLTPPRLPGPGRGHSVGNSLWMNFISLNHVLIVKLAILRVNLYSTMSLFNQTTDDHRTFFTLTGIPGMPEKDLWMALPLCLLYSTTFLGNVTILIVIKVEQSLHEPMYYFLAMLAATDLSLSLSSMPTMVSVHWFSWQSITFNACITQMSFIHTFGGVESGVLVAMAFDRFVAIRYPLHYATILTHGVIGKIGAAILLRSMGAVLPVPFLIKRLPFCHSTVLSHAYCLHQDAMRLACADTSVNSIYGLLAVIFIIVFDALILLVSYILILQAVLGIASWEERVKAINTCLSHICAVLLFYVPLIGMTLIHRYGKHLSPVTHTFMANVYLLLPPVLNPIVYSVRTKHIQQHIIQVFCGGRVGS